MCSSNSDGNLSNIYDSEYSYHESDEDLIISIRHTFFTGKSDTKWNRNSNVTVKIKYRNKVNN